MNQPTSRSGLTTFTVIIIGLLALFLLIEVFGSLH